MAISPCGSVSQVVPVSMGNTDPRGLSTPVHLGIGRCFRPALSTRDEGLVSELLIGTAIVGNAVHTEPRIRQQLRHISSSWSFENHHSLKHRHQYRNICLISGPSLRVEAADHPGFQFAFGVGCRMGVRRFILLAGRASITNLLELCASLHCSMYRCGIL